jgi:hypothetical protein
MQRLALVAYELGKALFARGIVRDAFAWADSGPWRIAWLMDPERMASAGVSIEPVPFTGQHAARLFRAAGMSGRTFDGQREMVLGDFLRRASNEFGELIDYEHELRSTIIPEPGYPWPAPDGYYSARQKRWLISERPGWLLPENVVEHSLGTDSPGIDLCKLVSDEPYTPIGAMAARYGKGVNDYFLVTHATGSVEGVTRFGGGEDGWKTNAAKVNSCGGLLFPSVAVGPVPSANFGVGVLVADVGLVLRSIKPYRAPRSRAPATIYNTDAWTEETRGLITRGAIAAFDQLHGHSEYIYHYDLNIWPLGAPTPSSNHWEVDAVSTAAQLRRTLRDRFRLWKKGLTPDQVEELTAGLWDSPHRYPYLEGKVNGVMPLRHFPLAVVARQQAAGFGTFLELTGFEGELVVLDVPGEILEVMAADWAPPGMSGERRQAIRAWAWQQYGWHVSAAVLERTDIVDLL